MNADTKAKIEDLKKKIVPVLAKYPITRAGLFGSFVSGKDTKDSDVDLLFDYNSEESFSLFRLLSIQEELEKATGRKVDLVPERGIKEDIKEEIITSVVNIYG